MMNVFSRSMRHYIFMFFCITTPLCYPINLVFDMGGVLCDTSTWSAIMQLGPGNLALHCNSPRGMIFEYFDTLVPRDPHGPTALDEHNNALPQIMCDWLSGAYSSSYLLELVLQSLDKDQQLSNNKKRLIKNFAMMIFDNDCFVSTKKLSKSGIKFLKECKKQGHKLYLLSNWDDSIVKMRLHFPEFFALFDGQIISAEIHLLKPSNEIYQHLLAAFNLDPSQTILIDDQTVNVKAAYDLGIHYILCQQKRKLFRSKPDFKKVRQDLDTWLMVHA